MPDDKSTDEPKKAKAAPVAPLTLPEVHYLQAERQSLVMNRAVLDPPQNDAVDAAIKELDDKIAAIDKQLAG
jgi:hypothetical protein